MLSRIEKSAEERFETIQIRASLKPLELQNSYARRGSSSYLF
jgi:hypothetical protein